MQGNTTRDFDYVRSTEDLGPLDEAPRSLWDDVALGSGPAYEAARDDLVRHYQSLVRATGYRFKSSLPSYLRDEDLVSYGQFGLLKAIERYNPDLGPFRRFASSYIYGSVLDELRSQDWAPRGLRREQRLVREATATLRDTEETPSVAAVAAHLGWEAARLESTLRQVTNSHHQTLEGTDDFLGDTEVDGVVQSDLLCAVFAEAFEELDETTQYVLTRVYFLHETLIAVAQSTSIPLAVIRRVHMEAINHLFDQVHRAVS